MTRPHRPVQGLRAHAMPCIATALAIACLSVSAAFAGPGHAGDEGHAHDGPGAASAQSPRVVAISETFQLVGILKGGKLTIYLDRESDNAPVIDAKITLSASGPQVMATLTKDGTYEIPAGDWAKPGENEMQFSIATAGTSDLLGGVLILREPPKSATAAGSSIRSFVTSLFSRSNPGFWSLPVVAAALLCGVFVGGLFRRGRVLGAAAVLAAVASTVVPPAHAGPGHAGDDSHSHGPQAVAGASDFPRRLPDGSVFFPKPTQRLVEVRTRSLQEETLRKSVRLSGRVISNPTRSATIQPTVEGRLLPGNGRFVQIGQSIKAGEVLATVQPVLSAFNTSEVEQTAGQLDQQIALAKNRVEQFKRISTMPPERIKTAEIELDALKKRRASLSRRQAGIEELTAPIDGVVVSVSASIGQIVSPREAIFLIVDPKALMIEAHAYRALDTSTLKRARASADALPVFEVTFIGRSPALQQQANVLHFEVVGAPALELGRRVTLHMEIGAPVTGLVVPRTAIVQSPNGQFVVFTHAEAERFEPKPVRFDEIDGTRALLTGGITAGDKIVVEGASLVNQVR